MLSVCNDIHTELLGYTVGSSSSRSSSGRKGSSSNPPSLAWTVLETERITQHYPRGITRAILLTELEARWRLSVKRGEHSGKLRQALQTMTMSSTDIYSGHLCKVDEFRYRLRSYDGDDTSVLLLMHRRFSDFIAYVNHIFTGNMDFFATKNVTGMSRVSMGVTEGRRFLCTKTRLLHSNTTAIILPTEYAMFEIDSNSEGDMRLLQGAFKELHRAFLQQPSYRDDELQGCFVLVHEISEVKTYPTARARSYRLVSLQLVTLEGINQLIFGQDSASSSPSSAPMSAAIVFVLLFDDQVHMSDLWSPQDLLYIHRPCVSMNDQEPLFGMNIETRTSMGGTMVYPVATPIKKHPRREAKAVYTPRTSGKQMNPYHLIVGAITCISLVNKKTSNNSDGNGNVEIGEQQQQILSLEKSLSLVPSKNFSTAVNYARKVSLCLRVLCKENVNIKVFLHGTKVKCKRRSVLWCVLSTSTTAISSENMLFRLNCSSDLVASFGLGDIIVVDNAHVITLFGGNQIPLEGLPKIIKFIFRGDDSVDVTKNKNMMGSRLSSSLLLITIGKPYPQEIEPFMNIIAEENAILSDGRSSDVENKDHFKDSMKLTSSTYFQEIAGIASAKGSRVVNMSRIASFCNSPSVYPISFDRASSDVDHCGCISGKVVSFGDCRYLKPGLLAAVANGCTSSSNDSVVGSKRKFIDGEDAVFTPSALQSVVGLVSMQSESKSWLCLVATNTLNMATSVVVTDEDRFFIKNSFPKTPTLSFFVTRIDDITPLVTTGYNFDKGQVTAPLNGCRACIGSSNSVNIDNNTNGNDTQTLFNDLFETQFYGIADDESGDIHNRSGLRLPNVEEMLNVVRRRAGMSLPMYLVKSIDVKCECT